MSEASKLNPTGNLLKVEETLSSIRNAADDAEIWKQLSSFSDSNEFDGICCKCFPGVNETEIGIFYSATDGFNSELSEIIETMPAFADPLLITALRAPGQFCWSAISDNSPASKNHEDAVKRQLLPFGDAVVVPVYGPLIRNGYFCFHASPKRIEECSGNSLLHVLAQISYLRLCELAFGKLDSQNPLALRESEVLHWMAKGKSNVDIGAILKISPNTVNVYVAKIYDKLGVRDRVRAVMRAYALGLIR